MWSAPFSRYWNCQRLAFFPDSSQSEVSWELHCQSPSYSIHVLWIYIIIPVPPFQNPVLKSKTDMRRFLGIPWESLTLSAFKTDQILATATFIKQLYTKGSSILVDVWDVYRENCQSIFFSACLKAVCCFEVPENLFMFDFKEHSTVKWKLTVKTAAHALLVCQLDPKIDETGLAS